MLCQCQLGFDSPNLQQGQCERRRAARTHEQTLLLGLEVSLLSTGLRPQTRCLLSRRGVRGGMACIRADASLFVLTR